MQAKPSRASRARASRARSKAGSPARQAAQKGCMIANMISILYEAYGAGGYTRAPHKRLVDLHSMGEIMRPCELVRY